MRAISIEVDAVNGSETVKHVGQQSVVGVQVVRAAAYNASLSAIRFRLKIDNSVAYECGEDVSVDPTVSQQSDPVEVSPRLVGQIMWFCPISGNVDLCYEPEGGAGSAPSLDVILYVEE